MRVKSLIILTLVLTTCMISCKKAPLSVGKTITQSRPLPYFDKVEIYDDISLTFVKSDTCYMEITTGENLIDNISADVCDSVLKLKNDNILDWLRTYDYTLHARLYFKDINNVLISTSGSVNTENQFNSDTIYNPHPGDTLDYPLMYRFEVDGGSGDVDITLNNCPYLYFVYQYGTSNVNIHGENNSFLKIYKRSFGTVDALDYDAERVTVTSESKGDCYVSVKDRLVTRINSLGNIYYKGEPPYIDNQYGPVAIGRLIKL